MSDQLPPHDPIAEAGTLACVLCAGGEASNLFQQLHHDDFYDVRHVEVFRALSCLTMEGSALHVVTVGQWLRDKKRINDAGGWEYISSLPDQTPSAANFPVFLEAIRDKALRRAALNDAAELKRLAEDTAIPAHVVADACRRMREAHSTPQQIPEAKPIGELVFTTDGEDEILKHRLLSRGGGGLIVGSTGQGKSSFALDLSAHWANGRDRFGIFPARKLRILIIQAENDECDVAEVRDSVAAELNEAERRTFFDNVLVATEYQRTARALCDVIIAPLIQKHKPDLIILDPALAYIGGDILSAKDVGGFLRNCLNPVIKEGGCAVIIVHHTNKPMIGEKSTWQNGDFAYLGAGSAEWANWARFVLAIQTTASRGIFRLHAAKRGGRIGWKDETGATVYEKLIGHSKEHGRIYWREASKDELPKKGRPKESDPTKILRLLPAKGLKNPAWTKLAEKEENIPRTTFRRMRDEAEASGLIIKSVSGLWMPVGQNGQKQPE